VYIRTGRGDLARQTLERGLDIAKLAGDRVVEGMILNNLAIHVKNRREYDEARSLIARAAVAYTDAGQGILPGQLPAALANIDMAEGKLDDAEDHLNQAIATFRATNDRRNEAMMLNNFGYLRRIQGRIDEAEPLHLESLAIRREIGDRVGQGRILGMLSILYVNEGRYDDAKSAAVEAHAIAKEANDHLFMATALSQLAQAEFSAGDLDAARAAYAEALALFEGIDDTSRMAQVIVRLARIDIQDRRLASAKSRIDDVLTLARREALYEPLIEAMELHGDVVELFGKPGEAINLYRQTLAEIDTTGFVVTKDRVTRKLIKLLLDVNDLSAAEPLIGGQIEQGETPTDIRLRARYAFLLGDAERAADTLASVQATFAEHWTVQDDEQLAAYRAAAGSGK
jgi:tetratricopeptide (TPR) repeat protein